MQNDIYGCREVRKGEKGWEQRLNFAQRVEFSYMLSYLQMQSASALDVQAPSIVNKCLVQLLPLEMPQYIHFRLPDITQYLW